MTIEEKKIKESTSEEILEKIVRTALVSNASDIHIDPGNARTIIRYRVNGQLQLQTDILTEKYQEILSKIKISCNLRIDDHISPKDGSFSMEIDGSEIFFRVSILSTRHGENLVIRVLKNDAPHSLLDVGINEDDRNIILFSLSKQGTIGIVMGPTGSGKTTTLYALLRELRKDDMMAVTIEDPVEYWIEGVRQLQVSESINFSNVLKSALRQDPDIILVGEIRDYETALLAFQAALTGHVVITSIHAYDGAHLIPRLLSLGVPDYLINGLHMVVINQRLVESMCDSCKEKKEFSEEDLEKWKSFINVHELPADYREAEGCSNCNYTGVGGRILAYEVGLGKEIEGGRKSLKDHIIQLVISSTISFKLIDKYI
jgi:type IV pilus assembly protein PilB